MNLNIKQSFEVCGFLRLIARGPDGEVRKDTGWFKNLITDTGLNMLGDSAIGGTGQQGCLAKCAVGSGNTPPTIGDTALQTQVAITSTVNANTFNSFTTAPWYAFYRRTFRFATGAAAGNLTEVGIFGLPGSNPMLSRALIVDGGGSPITLTILSDEILDVVYEFRVYPLQADLPFNVTISSVNYSCVARAAGLADSNRVARNVGNAFSLGLDQFGNSYAAQAYSGALGTIGTNPAGTVANSTSAAFSSYVPGSFTRDLIFGFNLGAANFGAGGIPSVLAPNSIGWYQISFSPAIPKDNTKTLTLTLTYTWTRRVI